MMKRQTTKLASESELMLERGLQYSQKERSENSLDLQSQPKLFYLSNYLYGGCATFTAHLLHTINQKYIYCLTKAFENDLGDFGYGIYYQRKPLDFLLERDRLFITDMYLNFNILDKLKNKQVTIVLHDPGEIFRENIEYIRNWNVIVIRKTMQDFLKNNHGIKSRFLYHPFYPHNRPIVLKNNDRDAKITYDKRKVISISRIDYNKNIDIILKANKKLYNPIRIYGWANSDYINSNLRRLDFYKYYQGTFEKSFSQVSNILNNSKFLVDLSVIPSDGGGTQYTFLEAIYNNTPIILNRKWIETVDKKHREFKEGYNCYAVSNEEELVELLNKSNLDTAKVVDNTKKLMKRHINISKEWNKIILHE
jgi:glycosyltransferase involved in cell wall biosynthesis